MKFEELSNIEEEKEESYPCECGGKITFDKEENTWQCNSCDFIAYNEEEKA